jgi:alkanesulfonate monooxygenase SsuD/methylene tetrahydromethanopterin reductase-like flavin-dependent oxidoreductase (luciferase family)
MGGMSEPAIKRTARIADGWLPQLRTPDAAARDTLDRLRGYMREAGRDPASFGIEVRMNLFSTPPEAWASTIDAWRELGATHLGLNTMAANLESPQAHIDAIRRFREEIGAAAV